MVNIETNSVKAYLKRINDSLLFEDVSENTSSNNRHFNSALYFFLYAEIEKREAYKDFAFDLLQTALYFKYKSQSFSDLSFDTGLTGMGWILLRMSHYGFFEVDDDDIFRPIDEGVSKLTKGEDTGNSIGYLCGLGFYILERINMISTGSGFLPIFKEKIDYVYEALVASLKATQCISHQELYKSLVFKENYGRALKIPHGGDSLRECLLLKTQSLDLAEKPFAQPQDFFYTLKLLHYITPKRRISYFKDIENCSGVILDNIYSKPPIKQVNHLTDWILVIREFIDLQESTDSKSLEVITDSLNTLLRSHEGLG